MNKQIPKHYELARRGLDCDGVAVDVYATTDDVGYILGGVTLTGDDRDIYDLMKREHVALCEKTVEHYAAIEADEMRIHTSTVRSHRPASHSFEREFCIG